MEETNCREALHGTKCKLGRLGCGNVQISGNSALNIKNSSEAGYRKVIDLPVLGPGQYDLMVIGDFTTLADDNVDLPFQDEPSGIVLDHLEKAGHDLNRVWMTKMVKCAAPKRRKPTIAESNTCRDAYLRKEVELIMPKVIMLVGAQALKACNLTGHGSINTIRGEVFETKFAGWHDGPTFKVVPTLNPGVFFHTNNPRLKARIGYDYVVAKQLLDGVEPQKCYKPPYTLIDSLEKLDWLDKQLAAARMIAYDTESAALNPRTNPLLSIQIAWGENDVAVIPFNVHDPDAPKEQTFHTLPGFGIKYFTEVKAVLKKVFENPFSIKAAHNFKYDLNVLRYHFGFVPKGFFTDVFVQKHLMDEHPPSDLEFCCDLELFWGDYSYERRQITGSGRVLIKTFDKVPDNILWQYGATDALGTYRLAGIYTSRLQTEHPNLWKYYCEESEPLIKALAKAEYKGALLDVSTVDTLEAEYRADLKSLLTDLKKITWPDFNPNSNDQVIKALTTLGVKRFELEDESKAHGVSANRKKLQDVIVGNLNTNIATMAQNVLDYRNRTKLVSTYLINSKKDVDSDGRLRHSWVQAGPVTGRLSCRFFHQIPKIDEARIKAGKLVMRDMLVAPKGYKYVYADYSQVELRIVALIANDLEMLSILANNGDLHAATAFEFLSTVWRNFCSTDLLESQINKFNRTEVGKRVNFGLIYGSEGYALVKQGKWLDGNGVERPFTWEMLNEGMRRWKARFTGVGNFIDEVPSFVRSCGGVAVNNFGRERHFGGALNHTNKWEREKAERECINFYVQSAASSLTNRTIIEIDRLLEAHNISDDKICLVNTVHDSMTYEVIDYLVSWFVDALRIIGTRQIPELNNDSFKLDIGSGQSWREAELAA